MLFPKPVYLPTQSSEAIRLAMHRYRRSQPLLRRYRNEDVLLVLIWPLAVVGALLIIAALLYVKEFLSYLVVSEGILIACMTVDLLVRPLSELEARFEFVSDEEMNFLYADSNIPAELKIVIREAKATRGNLARWQLLRLGNHYDQVQPSNESADMA